MSARNSAKAKAARRWQRAEHALEVEGESSPVTCHGICRECNRRRRLWLPARICEPCLMATKEAQKMVRQLTDAVTLMFALMRMWGWA